MAGMTLTQEQKARIGALGVRAVYLFGSVAEGAEQSLSDVDVGIVFNESGDVWPGIYQELYDIFTGVFPGRLIDIVLLSRASLELRCDVVKHGQVLYERAPEDRLEFEQMTTILYADFKPVLDEMNQAVIG